MKSVTATFVCIRSFVCTLQHSHICECGALTLFVCAPVCVCRSRMQNNINFSLAISVAVCVCVYGMPQPIRKVYYAISVDGLERKHPRVLAHMSYKRDMNAHFIWCLQNGKVGKRER